MLMQAQALTGRAVVALSTAAKVGRVADVLFDAEFRRVLGFRVKQGGLFGRAQGLPRASVAAIGAAAVTVATPDAINDEARFAELADAATLRRVQGTKVVTEGGELLGTITHLELDDEARRVTAYRLAASLLDRVLLRAETFVEADEVLRLGEGGIMIVADAVAARLRAARG
jgi:uncharacterized protein YrrD